MNNDDSRQAPKNTCLDKTLPREWLDDIYENLVHLSEPDLSKEDRLDLAKEVFHDVHEMSMVACQYDMRHLLALQECGENTLIDAAGLSNELYESVQCLNDTPLGDQDYPNNLKEFHLARLKLLGRTTDMRDSAIATQSARTIKQKWCFDKNLI